VHADTHLDQVLPHLTDDAILLLHRYCVLYCLYERIGARGGAHSSSALRFLTRKKMEEKKEWLEGLGGHPLSEIFSGQ
jgi:hypothetical protein